MSSAGSVTNVAQSTNRAVIDWQSFSIASGETVNFLQPSALSVTLNRVVGNESSVIAGALNANGNVFIVNSAGVLFTKMRRSMSADLWPPRATSPTMISWPETMCSPAPPPPRSSIGERSPRPMAAMSCCSAVRFPMRERSPPSSDPSRSRREIRSRSISAATRCST
ncbi:filamentous hemagglutinin N-terminal domain-containing protein [Methylosinus trichosporium]|uniref:two-partner secretion domain-containing protein n=1 Tax=Methylosinus trichosporium TaxID=426 RepID=UPI001FCE7823|nr:filamentous hemagglutinin N-terminal domain-containing protein [Methylosinus trichosporium]